MDDLSVHHIVPINEDESRAYEMHNAITLCRAHHGMAECGEIGREHLEQLAGTPPALLPKNPGGIPH